MNHITVNFLSLDLCLPTLVLAIMVFDQSFLNLLPASNSCWVPIFTKWVQCSYFAQYLLKQGSEKMSGFLPEPVGLGSRWCIFPALIALDRSNFTEINGAGDCRATSRVLRSKAGLQFWKKRTFLTTAPPKISCRAESCVCLNQDTGRYSPQPLVIHSLWRILTLISFALKDSVSWSM